MIAIIKINNFPIGKPSKKKSIPINKIISTEVLYAGSKKIKMITTPIKTAGGTKNFNVFSSPDLYLTNICDTYSIIDIFNYGNFINRSDNPVINSSFQLNGKNRFQERDGFFYNYIQPYYYFINSPPDGVNTYAFSLNPNDTQPSGTINLGYINSKDLLVSLGKYNNTSESYLSFFQSGNIRIFAYCYNLLKIYNGSTALGY